MPTVNLHITEDAARIGDFQKIRDACTAQSVAEPREVTEFFKNLTESLTAGQVIVVTPSSPGSQSGVVQEAGGNLSFTDGGRYWGTAVASIEIVLP